jgi:flagellar assembly protein FliH
MSSSSEPLARGRILRGAAVTAAPADMSAIASASARRLVVHPDVVEAARREGFEAGFAEGFQEGYDDGLSRARDHTQLLAQLVQRLSDAADALLTRETTAREEIENDVVETAFTIAEALVGHALAQPDERARAAIARALALAPEQGLVTARLNPADVAVIEPERLATGRAIEFVADPSVLPGDCVIDVGACRVDARIGAALERVREVLS